MQDNKLQETIRHYPTQKLRELTAQAEDAIRMNRALIRDYTLFVIGQQELARRNQTS